MEDQYLDASYEDRNEITAGWPGDGSGQDDLADMNQNEADDYRDEGLDQDRDEVYNDNHDGEDDMYQDDGREGYDASSDF